MSPRRVRAVARRIVAQFRHDRRSLGLLVGAPLLIFTLVWALWGAPAESSIRVAVAIDSNVPEVLLRGLEASDQIEVTTRTYDRAKEELRSGTVDAVISLEGDPRAPDVLVEVEGSDPFRTGGTIQAVQAAVIGLVLEVAGPQGPTIAVSHLYGGEDYTLLDHLAPLLIALFAFFFTFLLSAVAFLRERTSGTLERLMASPLRRGELVIGYLVGFSIFALIQAAVIIGFTVLVLNIRYTGNLGTVFLITAMVVIVSVSIGLFVSAFARNELQAIQFIPLVVVPQIFLSGLLVPVDQLHPVLQPIAAVLPLTYAMEALRAVMIKGFPLSDPLILRDIAVIGAFAAVTITGAILSIRREVA